MKLRKILLLPALAVLAFAACDDDDDTTTSKSMTGSMTVTEIPAYTNPGDYFDLEVSGLDVAEDEENDTLQIVYYFKEGSLDADTTTTYTLVIPDTLGTYTVTVTATATGYYTRTSTLTTIVVSEKSITGEDRALGAPTITDARDSKTYYTVDAGGKTWLAQNLAYFETDSDGNYTLGRPYEACVATEDIMGGYYDWTDAQSACPSGWRLPTADEFDALGTDAGALMCDSYYNGSRLWEFWPDVKVTNSLGFYAYPFGYATIVDDDYTFYGFNDYCYYWVDNSGSPMCRAIYVKDPDIKVWGSPSATDFAAQIRCVK